MRRHVQRAAVSAAVLAGLTGCSAQRTVEVAPQPAAPASAVQQAVTKAWEADRAGDSDRALAGYLEVLAEDPNNKWAASRVARLSESMPQPGAMLADAGQPKSPAATTPTAPKAAASFDRVPDSAATSEVNAIAATNPFEAFEGASDRATFGQTAAETSNAPAMRSTVSNVSFKQPATTPDFRSVGGPANPEVVSLLGDLSSPLSAARSSALEQLALMGSEAAAAMPAVAMLLSDADGRVRADAAWASVQISGETAAAVETLSRLLASDESSVRSRAAQVLGLIGPPASAALLPLNGIASQSLGVESIRAVEAIVRINPGDPQATKSLAEATRFGREAVRAEAVYAMGALSVSRAAEVVPSLTNALHDDAESVRTAAALTLGHFGEAAESARRPLEAAARFDTEAVRGAARASLACLPQ